MIRTPRRMRWIQWVIFYIAATMFLLGMAHRSHADELPTTCEAVVKAVGKAPLWVAEKLAHVKYPQLTGAQLAWGRQCIIDHRSKK